MSTVKCVLEWCPGQLRRRVAGKCSSTSGSNDGRACSYGRDTADGKKQGQQPFMYTVR